jgi:hypothetical protein
VKWAAAAAAAAAAAVAEVGSAVWWLSDGSRCERSGAAATKLSGEEGSRASSARTPLHVCVCAYLTVGPTFPRGGEAA